METVRLGMSSLRVSRVAFGGCPMGGHAWGPVSDVALKRAVGEALDAGINFFDTADTYGLGQAERTLGTALGARRDRAIIASKFGVRVENGRTHYDNSPHWIRRSLESSLRRLGTDYVDVYQIHYRDGVTPLADVVGTLKELKDQGKIRYFGHSNIGAENASELRVGASEFVGFQNEFSLASRDHEGSIRELSAQFGWTPLTWGSLGQGVLSGKYDATTSFDSSDRRSRATYRNFHGRRFERNLRIVDVLREVSASLGKSMSAVAIRWILDHMEDSVAVVGIKNTDQLISNVGALGWRLPTEALLALNAVSTQMEDAHA